VSLAFVFISETLMPVVVTSDGLPGGSNVVRWWGGVLAKWLTQFTHTETHTHTHTAERRTAAVVSCVQESHSSKPSSLGQ